MFITRVCDRINPIVVKETRQAVQSRVLIGLLMIFLIINMIIVAITIGSSNILTNHDLGRAFKLGRNMFVALYTALCFLSMIFIPLYAGNKMSKERSGENIDLLYITTIGPWKIIRGKLISSIVFLVLLYSISMPFMTFTYLLRGIDLPSMFVVSLISFFMVIVATQLTLFMATVSSSKAFSSIMRMGTLILLFIFFSGFFPMYIQMLYKGIGSRLGTADFWSETLVVTLPFLFIFILLHIGSVASISPSASNRMLPIRIYLAVCWIIGTAFAILLSVYGSMSDAEEIWAVLSVLVGCIYMLFVVSETETFSMRIRKTIPRGLLGRFLVFPFYTGTVNGIAWCGVYIAATIGLNVILEAFNVFSLSDRELSLIACFLLYTGAYSLTSLLLQRTLLKNLVPRKLTGLITIILVVAGSTLPYTLTIMTLFTDISVDWTWPFNLIDLLDSKKNADKHLAFSAIWLFIMVTVNIPWFFKQIKQFKPGNNSTNIISA